MDCRYFAVLTPRLKQEEADGEEERELRGIAAFVTSYSLGAFDTPIMTRQPRYRKAARMLHRLHRQRPPTFAVVSPGVRLRPVILVHHADGPA